VRPGLLALLVALCSATAALAEEQDAAGLLDLAVKRFADGAIDEAEVHLRAAAGRTEDPGLLARIELQIGLVHATRGLRARAREAFRSALVHDPGVTLDPHRYRPDFVELFRAVRDETVGQLRVTSGLAGEAQVWVDGQRACAAPCSRPLVAGRHWLELRDSSGRRLAGRSIVLMPGEQTSLTLGAPASRPIAVPASRPVDRPASQPAGPTARTRPRRRLWTWIAGAGALVTGAAALGLGLAARADHQEACDLLEGPEPCSERTSLADRSAIDRYRDLREAVHRNSLAANIGWGVAGGLAVTAVVLFVVEGRGGESPRAAPGVSTDGSGVSLHLSLRY